MKLVIDASVALKWFLQDNADEDHLSEALSLLAQIRAGNYRITQPTHWLVEIVAVLARHRPDIVPEALAALDELSAENCHSSAVLMRAAKLSSRLNQHAFDTLYHAVALENGLTLITADERYWRAAQGDGSIELLKNFKASK